MTSKRNSNQNTPEVFKKRLYLCSLRTSKADKEMKHRPRMWQTLVAWHSLPNTRHGDIEKLYRCLTVKQLSVPKIKYWTQRDKNDCIWSTVLACWITLRLWLVLESPNTLKQFRYSRIDIQHLVRKNVAIEALGKTLNDISPAFSCLKQCSPETLHDYCI